MKTTLTWDSGVAWRAVSDSGQSIVIDGAEKIGGTGRGPRPMELVLKGLCGCAAMDIMVILKKQRQWVHAAKIEADAIRTETVPAVFESIQLTFYFEGEELKPALVGRAVSLSVEKYCSVAKMLSHCVEISYSVVVNGDSISK